MLFDISVIYFQNNARKPFIHASYARTALESKKTWLFRNVALLFQFSILSRNKSKPTKFENSRLLTLLESSTFYILMDSSFWFDAIYLGCCKQEGQDDP